MDSIIDYLKIMVCSVPLWVYVMALCLLGGGVVWLVIKRRSKRKKIFSRLFLCVYVIMILCSTAVFRGTRTISHHGFDPFWHYKAFSQGKWLLLPEAVMNVLMFIPIGLAQCSTFMRMQWWKTVVIGMALSVGIELLQLVFKRGCADIDDVIHNTLGYLMGCCLYLVVPHYRIRGKESVILLK